MLRAARAARATCRPVVAGAAPHDCVALGWPSGATGEFLPRPAEFIFVTGLSRAGLCHRGAEKVPTAKTARRPATTGGAEYNRGASVRGIGGQTGGRINLTRKTEAQKPSETQRYLLFAESVVKNSTQIISQ